MKNSDFFSKTLGNNEQKMERYHSGSPVNSSTMALFLSIPEQTTAQFGHLQSAVMPSEEAVMTHIKIRPAAGHSTSLIPTISPDVSTKHSTERKKKNKKMVQRSMVASNRLCQNAQNILASDEPCK